MFSLLYDNLNVYLIMTGKNYSTYNVTLSENCTKSCPKTKCVSHIPFHFIIGFFYKLRRLTKDKSYFSDCRKFECLLACIENYCIALRNYYLNLLYLKSIVLLGIFKFSHAYHLLYIYICIHVF